MTKERDYAALAGIAGAGLAVLLLGKYLSKDSSAPKGLIYNILFKDRNVEVRDYKPYRVAKVIKTGDRKSAANEAFKLLFKYIQGRNLNKKKIPMTAPVTQMAKDGPWEVNFVMPDNMKLNNIPKPKDRRIILREEDGGKFIVHKFSGLWNNSNIQKHKEHLDNYINNNNLRTEKDAIYAFYNSPSTLPWRRRNEVMYKIA